MNPVYVICKHCKTAEKIAGYSATGWQWDPFHSRAAMAIASHMKCTEIDPVCVLISPVIPDGIELQEPEIISGATGVEEKRRCPDCGSLSQNYETTYMGFLGVKDENQVRCGDCGWEGLAHEMDESARFYAE